VLTVECKTNCGSMFVFFFFSSRRRHTRSYGDWSSDVCSSDLMEGVPRRSGEARAEPRELLRIGEGRLPFALVGRHDAGHLGLQRSEERRVGKECRSGWVRPHSKKTE